MRSGEGPGCGSRSTHYRVPEELVTKGEYRLTSLLLTVPGMLQKKILVVDDDAYVRTLVMKVLNGRGQSPCQPSMSGRRWISCSNMTST